jgi:deoxycytidylate deaminase
MSFKFNLLCNKLIDEACNSSNQYQLAACLLQYGKMINTPKCNVSRNCYRGYTCGSLHAEARVLVSHFGNLINYDRKFGWRFQLDSRKREKHDVMVIRINKSDKGNIQLVNARPCQNCLEMMKSIKIRRVYYSNNLGEIICENIKDMVSLHSSRVMINFDIKSKTNTFNISDYEIKKINENIYWEQLMKNKIPDIMKEENFKYFIDYDFKSLESKYKIIINKTSYDKTAQILNQSNKIIKTIIIIKLYQ